MLLAKLLLLIAICLSVPNLGYATSRKVSKDVIPSPIACMNCSICQYPCNTPSPPASGYPSYGTPPPPQSLSYGSPPPPPPQSPSQGNCPPTPVVQYPPPITYGYAPYRNVSVSAPLPISSFSTMISVFSFAVLF